MKNNELIRVDKNLSYHYNYFKKYSLDDSGLMFMVLIYLARKHQYELFGDGILDPVDFCKAFKLEPSNVIWRKHENPRQLQEHTIEELQKQGIDVFDTVFENALYCLFKDIFEFTENVGYLTREGKVSNQKYLSSIQFITRLNKEEITKGAKNKVSKVYRYELSADFMNNLSFLFFNVNVKSLQKDIVKKNQGLYMYLKDIKNYMVNKKISQQDLSFTILKEKIGIDSDTPKYIKKKISATLDKLLKLEDLNEFSFEWVKGKNQRYAYTVRLILVNIKAVRINDNKQEVWNDVSENFLKKEMLFMFKRRYPSYNYVSPDELKIVYRQWLQDKDKDMDLKVSAYNTYLSKTLSVEDYERFRQRGFGEARARDIHNNIEEYM
ncbi:hypothetical protein ACT4R9_10395 [Ornithobacterium rhinotracheale]|uniref:hypothetical protein n=1 Tax=Ornithobacterium rhinotracheale TaxID=28251 RepID=UPI003FA42945